MFGCLKPEQFTDGGEEMKRYRRLALNLGNRSLFLMLALMLSSCGGGSSSSKQAVVEPSTPEPEVNGYVVNVSANEAGSAIYLNGVYTGELTPADITVDETGEYDIGIGLVNTGSYLKKSITVNDVETTQYIVLDDSDRLDAKTWRALFVGVNRVKSANGSCISSYSTAQLDMAYEFFKTSFKDDLEAYSYHTMDWQIERRDIIAKTITLSDDHLISPATIDQNFPDIMPGDFDLIVSFFNGGAGDNSDCFIDNFIGIAWFDVTVLAADASYFTIRYYDDIEAEIAYAKAEDPGMFIHEWLHTTAEWFYPDLGSAVPVGSDGVVHAAGDFGYQHPWMTWYQDLVSGQVPMGEGFGGITPEALHRCTVKESALGQC